MFLPGIEDAMVAIHYRPRHFIGHAVRQGFETISGPMPAGSPMVMPMVGFFAFIQLPSKDNTEKRSKGDVTLLKPDELGHIVRYAREIGLDPMVMATGQRLLQVPGYLPSLVRNYGLRKISFHVDTTQKGKPVMAMGLSEVELHPIPVRESRPTYTKGDRPDPARCTDGHGDTGQPDRCRRGDPMGHRKRRCFSDSEFPAGCRGRAHAGSGVEGPVDGESVGADLRGCRKAVESTGYAVGTSRMQYDRPVVVVRAGNYTHLEECVGERSRWDRPMFRILVLGYSHFKRRLSFNSVQLCISVFKRPWRIPELLAYALWRALCLVGPGFRVLASPLRWERVPIAPLLLVVHKFMNAEELDTPIGQERLQVCVFKVPVDGKMISMCEVNGPRFADASIRRK